MSNQIHIQTASPLDSRDIRLCYRRLFIRSTAKALGDKHMVETFTNSEHVTSERMCNIFPWSGQSWGRDVVEAVRPFVRRWSRAVWRLFHTIRLFNVIGSDCRFTNINFVFFWFVIDIINECTSLFARLLRSSYRSKLLFQFTGRF